MPIGIRMPMAMAMHWGMEVWIRQMDSELERRASPSRSTARQEFLNIAFGFLSGTFASASKRRKKPRSIEFVRGVCVGSLPPLGVARHLSGPGTLVLCSIPIPGALKSGGGKRPSNPSAILRQRRRNLLGIDRQFCLPRQSPLLIGRLGDSY